MTSSVRRTWETRLMHAASAGDPEPNMPVAKRVAVEFLRSDEPELDLHTAAVLAELVAADVPEAEQVGFVRLWIRELRDALRRA